GSRAMREDKILPALVRKIQEIYLAPDRLEELRAELWRKVQASSQAAPDRTGRLREHLARIDADIVQGARNLLRSADNLAILNQELTALRNQRAQLAKELDREERSQAVPVEEMRERVERAVAKLATLGEQLHGTASDKLRPVLLKLVSRVDVYFDAERKAHKT